MLTGREIPDHFISDSDADAHELLTKPYKKSASLKIGLGLEYPTDGLTFIDSATTIAQIFQPGERAPDLLVQRLGLRFPLRLLHSATKNHGKFTIMVFCEGPRHSQASSKNFREYLDDFNSFSCYSADIFQGVTIIAGSNDACSSDERPGTPCFGYALYDVDGLAHERYDIPLSKGAVFGSRPDGTIRTVCAFEIGQACRDALKGSWLLRRKEVPIAKSQ